MINLLLIDDEKQLLQNLAFFFEDEGYNVFAVESGEEGLEVLRKEDIQVCVVDMRLPGIDGNEVIRVSLAEGILRKFLIHTGSTDYRLPQDLLERGMTPQHVFLKPVADMTVLADALVALQEGS